LVLASRAEMLSAIGEAKHAAAIFIGKKAEIGAAETRELPADASGFAAALFVTLHDLDDAGCDMVVVEAPPDSEEWLAVRDRLTRAKS
ncbi:MAG: Sua5 family C-terminal domain-containing protein, partial [Polyangiaceae bacterium]